MRLKRVPTPKSSYYAQSYVRNSPSAKAEISIITNKKNWDNFLSQVDFYDVFHTYDFHAHCLLDNEYPILFVCAKEHKQIAIPFIIRAIKGTDYFDATSAYGYSGPVYKGFPDKSIIKDFQNHLQKFLKSNSIITVFSRLDPLLDLQTIALEGLGEVVEIGGIVNIDLRSPDHLQFQNYSSRLRTYIRSISKKVEVQLANTPEEVDQFVDIYYETMNRVESSSNLIYPKENLLALNASTDLDTRIVIARDKETNQIIAGSLFLMNKLTCHYYLSGTRTNFLRLQPSKLIIDFMRKRCKETNQIYFNLGGGLGGKMDHSLFRFKSGFSKNILPFRIWKYIVDQSKYKEVNKKYGINRYKKIDYFPAYRSPEVSGLSALATNEKMHIHE